MKYLINLSNSKSQLDWFGNDYRQMTSFLNNNLLDGIELIFYGSYGFENIPQGSIQGIHLSFWPIWLDFWRDNKTELLRQFGSLENIELYYGGLDRETMINYYRGEFTKAQEVKANYAVFHVSHAQIEHVYTWDFPYSDWDVLEDTAELVNKTFGEEDTGVTLLFENLWWPGLTFTEPGLAEDFFNLIKYPRKGFMLDIGHLMITNRELKDEETACAYILEKIEGLGDLKHYIQGVHLSKSFPGEYLKQDHSLKREKVQKMEGIWERCMEVRNHVLQIDQHAPFEGSCIQRVIEEIDPDYVVYELVPENFKELEDGIAIQNKSLGRS